MPSELLQRLNRFLSGPGAQSIAHSVMALETVPRVDVLGPPPVQDPQKPNKPRANTRAHWPAGSFGNVMSPVQSIMIHGTGGWPSYASANSFRNLFSSLDYLDWREPHGTTPGAWVDKRGIGPQYFVDPNGTAYVLIGHGDLSGDPRRTWHGEELNPITLGIENSDVADSGVSLGVALSAGPNDDLTGLKAYILLHPAGAEDVMLTWVAQFPRYLGSGDIVDGANPATDRRLNPDFGGWRNTLFSERDYRTLALLCRLLTEQNGIPRNFLPLPYVRSDHERSSADVFRQLLLSDQQRDTIAVHLGTSTSDARSNNATFRTWYQHASADIWLRYFGMDRTTLAAQTPCYRGFLSHYATGHHPCPGPLFDWHRFAREVWDWWWYPFDTTPVGPTTTRRSYLRARRTTTLVDYYFDATGTDDDYNRLHAASLTSERFALDAEVPVYALANGVVVAARFALGTDPAASGFVLVRHEVFHQTGANADRIDYDHAPTFVWSLISFLANPAFSINQIGDANPDWLNRLVMRLKECELAVQYHHANAGNAALARGWARLSDGSGPRFTTGEEIERDADGYRALANDLAAGRVAVFPLEAQPAPTPVRVIVGDYLGGPNQMSAGQSGIEVGIFSNDKLDVPGATYRVCSASSQPWWTTVTAANRHESSAAMDLPASGLAWHYQVTDFLRWINGITWTSEWHKYGVAGPAPARPQSRLVL